MDKAERQWRGDIRAMVERSFHYFDRWRAEAKVGDRYKPFVEGPR